MPRWVYPIALLGLHLCGSSVVRVQKMQQGGSPRCRRIGRDGGSPRSREDRLALLILVVHTLYVPWHMPSNKCISTLPSGSCVRMAPLFVVTSSLVVECIIVVVSASFVVDCAPGCCRFYHPERASLPVRDLHWRQTAGRTQCTLETRRIAGRTKQPSYTALSSIATLWAMSTSLSCVPR